MRTLGLYPIIILESHLEYAKKFILYNRLLKREVKELKKGGTSGNA
jgi:hypothetical protein